ncbi:MAG: hypothetical protein ABI760_01110 [Ferruginibacter sp.]
MEDFKDTRKLYIQSKTAWKHAKNENYQAHQQYQLLEIIISDFLKTSLMQELPAGNELGVQRDEAIRKMAAASDVAATAGAALAKARTAFDSQGTANTTVANINDTTPILLLPLRLQTRFLTIKHIARNLPPETLIDYNTLNPFQKQNVNSIFPDLKPKANPLASISSPAFTLSNIGLGNAKWIIDELNHPIPFGNPANRILKVEDEVELWVRIFPDDIFLQSHESALTASEMKSAKIFWQAMWDAERESRTIAGDPVDSDNTKHEKQLVAWKTLRSVCLPHRANWIARVMRPADFPDNFPGDLVEIPASKFPEPGIKADSWTIPPSTDMLPEHFIVNIHFNNSDLASREIVGAPIPDYLQLGFDPDEQDENAFSDNGKVLKLPAAIRWLTDINEAEKSGMAVRIPLSVVEYSSGILKLAVVGIKTGADETEGARLVTALFDNHHYKPDGMAFLPHGTPTNNLPGQSSGFRQGGVTDEQAFESEFPAKTEDRDIDGRRLATALGLEQGTFDTIFNSHCHEAQEALMVNRALWPATLGYYLDNHMRPAINDGDIDYIKSFFENFVTGRGLLPPFRIGKQPYGIVPSTVWSRWKPGADASPEEKRLINFLGKMDSQWARLVDSVKTMKKVFSYTDEQMLKNDFREILSMQASSTRFFRRLVAGEYLLWNVNKLSIPFNADKAGIKTTPNEYKTRLESMLAWAEPVNTPPRILGKFFDDDNYKLTDLPPDAAAGQHLLNEEGTNYFSFLLDRTFEQLKDHIFEGDFNNFVAQKSSILMFYTARFSLFQGWVEAATSLLRSENPAISPLARLDFEMEYLDATNNLSTEHAGLLASSNIGGNFETRKNKWSLFEQFLSDGTRVDSKIQQRLMETLSDDDPVKHLQDTIKALSSLSTIPADRLERIFSEHVDICSFRLDAWLQGLALSRLFGNRKKEGFEKGVIVGSFGWLEAIRPGINPWVEVREVTSLQFINAQQADSDRLVMPVIDLSGFTPDQLPEVRKYIFAYLGSEPATNLAEDPVLRKIVPLQTPAPIAEGGYVLTPSLEHAATAGILRAGYEHHALSQGPDSKTLAVNVGSERTGWAMDLLKGLQAGHSLNEQLGYFIERRMYDQTVLAQYIPTLRSAFPLQIEQNEWDDDQQIGKDEKVHNLSLVTDGLAILKSYQSAIDPWLIKLSAIFETDQPAITEFGKIIDLAAEQFDAVSDLVIAESVFQTVKGSPERAAAALRMVGEASDITLPEVVNITGESRVLTHRLGFVLNTDVNLPGGWPTGPELTSLFSSLSPDINRWLADQLPSPDRIFVKMITTDSSIIKIDLGSLDIQAIDLFYLLHKTGLRPQESLIAWWCMEAAKKQPGADPQNISGVAFDRDESFHPGELSVKEIIPLIKSIGSMLDQSRPMRPEDFQVMTDNKAVPNSALYDNSSLLAICQKFADSSVNGPLGIFLKKLTDAKAFLEANFPKGFGSTESDVAYSRLIRLIPEAFMLGFWDVLPRCPDNCNQENATILLDQASRLIELLEKRRDKVGAAFTAITAKATTLEGDKLFEELSNLARLFGGEDFIVLPRFRLPDTGSITASYNDESLSASIGEFGLEEWIQGLAMVRGNIQKYQLVNNLRIIFDTPANGRITKILQLPFVAGTNNQWIGTGFKAGFEPPPQVTSMAYEFSSAFSDSQPVSGILLDDWREKVPLPELTAGVSIKYDQSNAEAPQCLLLLVAPELKGAWDWQSIVDGVSETIELAKKRAVDGELIQTTWLSQFLPAIVTPVDGKNNTPNLDFKVAGPFIKPFLPDITGGGINTGGGGIFTTF